MPMDIEEYAEHVHFYDEHVPDLLLDYLKRSHWDNLIDVGCGDGALLWALNRRGLFEGKEVFGVDLSRRRIETARAVNPDFHCYVNSATDLSDIPDDSIDFLVSTQVIEHVPDDRDMVGEINRVLRRRGTVYLSTIHKKWYGWYFYRCNGRWVLDPTHVREYSQDNQLIGKFDQAGFQVLENRKKLLFFPLIDFFLRRFGASRSVSLQRAARMFRRLKVPIPGYYWWELVLKRKDAEG